MKKDHSVLHEARFQKRLFEELAEQRNTNGLKGTPGKNKLNKVK